MREPTVIKLIGGWVGGAGSRLVEYRFFRIIEFFSLDVVRFVLDSPIILEYVVRRDLGNWKREGDGDAECEKETEKTHFFLFWE